MRTFLVWCKRRTFLTWACLAIAALVDFLFYKHAIGWTPGLLVLTLTLVLLLRNAAGRVQGGVAAWLLAACLLGLSVALAIEPGP